MKQPSVYLKMRVLGAVDTVEGRTRHQRVHHVAAMSFLDEEGNPRQFTWRTIQTWYYRYKNHGITGMTNRPRKDKGQVRKVTPEELLEALNAARPHFTNQRTNKRPCIASASRRACCNPTASPKPPSTASFASTTADSRGQGRQQETPRLQHEIRQSTLAGRHHVRTLR